MHYQINTYEFKTTGADNFVFWGNDKFWCDWPKLKELGLLTADYSGTDGHVTLWPTKLAGIFHRILAVSAERAAN